MNKRAILVFFLSITLMIFLTGCTSPEEKARTLYNKAQVIERTGDRAKAIKLYKKIIDKYPGTEIAVEINQMLTTRGLINKATADMVSKSRKESIILALQLYKLDNGDYPTTDQGVEALIRQPTIGRPARNWRSGGYLDDHTLIDLVSSYQHQLGSFDFTLVMR